MASGIISVRWREDSTADVQGRLTARNGSGKPTGKPGEGRWLQQADISTITCKVFDITADPDTAIATPTVTLEAVIFDTPILSQVDWIKDSYGYNFIHTLGPTNFPTGGNTIRVEYKVTMTDGGVFHGVYEGPTDSIRSS